MATLVLLAVVCKNIIKIAKVGTDILIDVDRRQKVTKVVRRLSLSGEGVAIHVVVIGGWKR